jgi:hypothetical protein
VTSAEYRTLREACGLTVRDAAAFHRVAERTIVHWESERNGIPDGAAEELRELNATIEHGVVTALKLAAEVRPRDGEPDAVALVRFRTPERYAGSRPAGEGLSHACHNAMIGRIMAALERAGKPVTISWG